MIGKMHDVHCSVNNNNAHRAFALNQGMTHHLIMNLARIRRQRGLTQAQLGDLINADQATVQRAEKMADSAMLRTYRLCADALGVTLADLLSEDRPAIEADLVAAFRILPQHEQERVLGLLRLAESQPET